MFGFLKKKISEFVSGIAKKGKEDKGEEDSGEKIVEKEVAIAEENPEELEKEVDDKTAELKREVIKETKPKIRTRIAEKKTTKEKPIKEARRSREREISLSLKSRMKGIISKEVRLSKTDIKDIVEDLELSFLEGDVAYDVAAALVADIQSKLLSRSFSKKRLKEEIAETIRESMVNAMDGSKLPRLEDVVKERLAEKVPVVIMFVGPNGAGKTTTIAKVSYLLMKNGLNPVIAASDTFRAAAIEQLKEHAKRLNVPVIAKGYGSDPASVAFDAINYAKAHGNDVVLIDTAGRQDTNRNLIDQLRKIRRVSQTDYVIYVGESIAGNAVIDQIRAFNEAVPIDWVILTKLDCDAKGGTAISIKKATGIPIIYFGVGQEYDALVRFDPADIVNRIVGEPA